MKFSANTIRRLASLAGLTAVVAALAVPTALARPATDVGDDMSHTAVVLDLRSPDTRDATTQMLGLDPAIATAIAAHQRLAVAGDLRSPDTRDVKIAAHQRLAVAGDLRSPDTRDVTVNPIARYAPVVAPATSDGTNWGLVAAMFAAIGLLLVGVGALAVQGHGKSHGTMKPA
jgi:hypothetical protein